MTIEDKIRALVSERLDKGLGRYGRFRADDKRDMPKEACEEAIDAAIYLSALCLRLGEIQDARVLLRCPVCGEDAALASMPGEWVAYCDGCKSPPGPPRPRIIDALLAWHGGEG